jgi:hypothetical protein
MIETREVTIYEIIGVKVGSTYDVKRRMREQGKPDYRVVQVIEPNTLTVRECWEQEQDWAIRLGYEPDGEHTWPLFEQNRTIGPSNGFLKLWKDPEFRDALSKYGQENSHYKGTIVNSNGERFEGRKQLEEAGYAANNVYACINGKRKTHKQHKWWREPLE